MTAVLMYERWSAGRGAEPAALAHRQGPQIRAMAPLPMRADTLDRFPRRFAREQECVEMVVGLC